MPFQAGGQRWKSTDCEEGIRVKIALLLMYYFYFLEIDVSFTYLKYFLEDDNELERIRNGYSSGKIPTGELKAITIAVLQQFVAEFQERLRLVTDDTLSLFLDPNKKIKYT